MVIDIIRFLNKREGGTFNIGTARGASVNELFKSLAEITGFKGKPVYKSSRAGELLKTYLDFNRAEVTLEWQPEVALEEGLKRTVEFFKATAESPLSP